MEAEDEKPRPLSGAFDDLIFSNLQLNATIEKYARKVLFAVVAMLVAVVLMTAISGFAVWHSIKTDRRLDRIEEKVFPK